MKSNSVVHCLILLLPVLFSFSLLVSSLLLYRSVYIPGNNNVSVFVIVVEADVFAVFVVSKRNNTKPIDINGIDKDDDDDDNDDDDDDDENNKDDISVL